MFTDRLGDLSGKDKGVLIVKKNKHVLLKNNKKAGILALLLILMMLMAGCESSESTIVSEGEIETTDQSQNDESSIGPNASEEIVIEIEATEPTEEEIPQEIESEEIEETALEASGDEIPKEIDLIFFMGQSNMSGCGGDYTQAPSIIKGAGYEYRSVTDPYNLHEIKEPFGLNESVVGGIWDVPGAKRGSLVTSFVNKYHELTGHTVIGVSASAGGTSTEDWLTTGFVTDISVRLKNVQDYLNNNDFTVKNQYVVWLQGESDALDRTTVDEYKTNMDNIIRPLFIGGCNKVFIITPGRINSDSHFFDNIISCQIDMCKNSGYYALASTALCAVPVSNMVDPWHYNQRTLNLVGEDAAEAVAYYTNNNKEMCIYDYKHDLTYIPNFFNYDGTESATKKDIAGMLSQ